MPLLYHAYVYLEFLILACTIYILAPINAVLGVEKITNRRESDGTTDHLENVMNLM